MEVEVESWVERASSGSVEEVWVEGPAVVEVEPVLVAEVEVDVDVRGVGSIRGSGSGGGCEGTANEPEEELPDVPIASGSCSGSFRFLLAEGLDAVAVAVAVPGRSCSFPATLPAVGG